VLTACLSVLRQTGILLKSDPVLPSIAALVAGEPIRGSWWAHPAGSRIYATLQELGAHPEVLMVKLVGGKDTLVHLSLWPEIYAIGSSGEPWQRVALSSAACELESKVARAGELEASGAPVKELELRLLIRCEQFHTDAGFHAKRLESWRHWADRIDLAARPVTPVEARAAFQSILPAAKFPWHAASNRRKLYQCG
jgi:hypothetical protein